MAATAAEITSRIPSGGDGFSASATAVTTVLVIGVGVVLIKHNLPKSLGRTAARFSRVS